MLGQSGKLAYRCVLFGVASPIVLCVLGCSRSTLGSSDIAALTPVSALEKIKLRDADRLHILERYPPDRSRPGISFRKNELPAILDRMIAAIEGASSVEVVAERGPEHESTHLIQFESHRGEAGFPLLLGGDREYTGCG